MRIAILILILLMAGCATTGNHKCSGAPEFRAWQAEGGWC